MMVVPALMSVALADVKPIIELVPDGYFLAKKFNSVLPGAKGLIPFHD